MKRCLPLHITDTDYWALLTCPVHTARDIEIRPSKEGHATFYQVRCRLCGRDQDHHDALLAPPGGRAES